MDNPGILNLGNVTLTSALTGQVITEGSALSGNAQAFIDRLEGMTSLTAFVDFDYGSGGTTCAVVIETSIDQGQNWIEILRFDFTTADAKKHATIGVFAAAAPAAVAALSAEGKTDNVLGDRLRAKITSTGTYAGTTVKVRAAVR